MKLQMSEVIGRVVTGSSIEDLYKTKPEIFTMCRHVDLRGCVWDYPAFGALIDILLEYTVAGEELQFEIENAFEIEDLERNFFLDSQKLHKRVDANKMDYTSMIDDANSRLTEMGKRIIVTIYSFDGSKVENTISYGPR